MTGLFDPPPVVPPGPYAKPVKEFAHLSEEVREWLEQLRPQDIKELHDAIEFRRNARTIRKFFIWIGGFIIGGITTGALLGEKLLWLWRFFFSAGGAPR
jgi:hypothetical protein